MGSPVYLSDTAAAGVCAKEAETVTTRVEAESAAAGTGASAGVLEADDAVVGARLAALEFDATNDVSDAAFVAAIAS